MVTETIEASSSSNEMVVLGAILNGFENAKIGLSRLEEDDFFESKHKIIFKAIKEIFNEKDVVDIQLTCNKLKSDGDLEAVGGIPYIIQLPQFAGTSCYVESYCDDLKQLTLKRQLLSLTNQLVNDLKQGAESVKVIEKLKAQIKQIEEKKSNVESAFNFLSFGTEYRKAGY